MTRKLCSLKSCDRPHSSHGYCSPHWLRVYHTGDPQEDKPIRKRRRGKQAKVCKARNCARSPVSQSLCGAHRYRLVMFGSVYADIPIGDPTLRKVSSRNMLR
jgi:hypothetical protein